MSDIPTHVGNVIGKAETVTPEDSAFDVNRAVEQAKRRREELWKQIESDRKSKATAQNRINLANTELKTLNRIIGAARGPQRKPKAAKTDG